MTGWIFVGSEASNEVEAADRLRRPPLQGEERQKPLNW
jgi:hypothetical protein